MSIVKLLKNLTKPAVIDPNGQVTFYDNPAEAGVAEAQAMQKQAQPQPVQAQGTVLSDGATEDNPAQIGPAPTAAMPKQVQPSFDQATTDQYGNVIPGHNQGLTKGGLLLKILRGGIQGGMDAVAGGALDAAPGKSYFGAGVQAAQQMPLIRAARANQMQQQQAETAMMQSQMQPISTPYGPMPLFRAKQLADITKAQAEAAGAGFKSVGRGGLYDVNRGAMVAGSQGQTGSQSTPEHRRAFADANPQLFPDEDTRNQYILYGTREPNAPKDTKVGERVGPDNVKYATFQKPDGTTYEVKIGSERPMASTIIDRAKEDDVDAAARSLIDPRNLTSLKDIASMRGDQRLKIFNRAKELDPSFDPGLTNHRIKFLQAYEDPKGRASINRQAINNILQHGADLLDLNNQYRARSEFRPLNTPINKLSQMFGSQTYTQFSTVNTVLKDELALYFSGGYAPTEDQKRMWDKIQADEATPAQTEAFAREVGRLAFRRSATFNDQFRKNMGYDDPDLVNPEAFSAAERMGLGDEVSKFGSGGRITGGGGYSQKSGGGKSRPPLSSFER